MRVALSLVALVALAGCAKIDSPKSEVVLPLDYKMSFVQVRGCRGSNDHDLKYVVVRVRSDLADVYNNGPYPFPPGALVVKELYGTSDTACRTLTGYAVMKKEAAGYYPFGGDWQYYDLDFDGSVMTSGPQKRCAGCHAVCGAARDRTCTEP